MKRVFISCPFKGRTEKEILLSITNLHHIAERMFEEELECVHNYQDYEVDENINHSMYCISKAIEKMSSCDYFIGLKLYGKESRGCEIEEFIADKYNMKKIIMNFDYKNNIGFNHGNDDKQ